MTGNKAVVSTFVEEVINQGRFERADDLVAVDFTELDPFPDQQQGREGLIEVIGQMRSAFPDIHWVLDEMVAEGDKVFSRFTWSGTHRGAFLGIPATGASVRVTGMVIDRVVDGKMAESRILMDRLKPDAAAGCYPNRAGGWSFFGSVVGFRIALDYVWFTGLGRGVGGADGGVRRSVANEAAVRAVTLPTI
jgi:steroid delta-isomerase-like uncharacterized protein